MPDYQNLVFSVARASCTLDPALHVSSFLCFNISTIKIASSTTTQLEKKKKKEVLVWDPRGGLVRTTDLRALRGHAPIRRPLGPRLGGRDARAAGRRLAASGPPTGPAGAVRGRGRGRGAEAAAGGGRGGARAVACAALRRTALALLILAQHWAPGIRFLRRGIGMGGSFPTAEHSTF